MTILEWILTIVLLVVWNGYLLYRMIIENKLEAKMENQAENRTVEINVEKETLFFKVLCGVFEASAHDVATVLKSMPDAQSDALIDLVANAETDEQIENARDLFNTALQNLNA